MNFLNIFQLLVLVIMTSTIGAEDTLKRLQTILRVVQGRDVSTGRARLSYEKKNTGESPIYYIKMPPTPYYFAKNVPNKKENLNKIPVSFQTNGKPSKVYHWKNSMKMKNHLKKAYKTIESATPNSTNQKIKLNDIRPSIDKSKVPTQISSIDETKIITEIPSLDKSKVTTEIPEIENSTGKTKAPLSPFKVSSSVLFVDNHSSEQHNKSPVPIPLLKVPASGLTFNAPFKMPSFSITSSMIRVDSDKIPQYKVSSYKILTPSDSTTVEPFSNDETSDTPNIPINKILNFKKPTGTLKKRYSNFKQPNQSLLFQSVNSVDRIGVADSINSIENEIKKMNNYKPKNSPIFRINQGHSNQPSARQYHRHKKFNGKTTGLRFYESHPTKLYKDPIYFKLTQR